MKILRSRDEKFRDVATQLSRLGYLLSLEKWDNTSIPGWRLDEGIVREVRTSKSFRFWMEDDEDSIQLHLGHRAYGMSYLIPYPLWITGSEQWTLHSRRGLQYLDVWVKKQTQWIHHWHTNPLPCDDQDLFHSIKRWLKQPTVKEIIEAHQSRKELRKQLELWKTRLPIRTEGFSALYVLGHIFSHITPKTLPRDVHWTLQRSFEPRVRMFCKNVS